MQRAGQAVFDLLQQRWPQAKRLLVLCGPGNNGGDGFVLARLAIKAGLIVHVVLITDLKRLKSMAAEAFQLLQEADVAGQLVVESISGTTDVNRLVDDSLADVIIDAMLGIGLDRDIDSGIVPLIAALNDASAPVLAVDIPSGLHADTGRVLGIAVQAAATISFIGLKQGLFTGQAANYCGDLVFADLQLPAEVYNSMPVHVQRFDYAAQLAATEHPLLPRQRCAHKGDFGHVLLVGGDLGMGGAIRMAAEAALRVGAGRVSVATRSEQLTQISAGRPELMLRGIDTIADLTACMEFATVVAIGPGLGQQDWGRHCFAEVLDTAMTAALPMVIDADGLNLLALEHSYYDRWVLTPHPGEAARLLAVSTAVIQDDRFAAAQEIQQRYGGVCVLKGAGTLVRSATSCAVCSEGNPGMAVAGMGDVLTGVIAGLLGSLHQQELSLETLAQLAVSLHARAADNAAAAGERGMLAMDLMPVLRRLVNPPLVFNAEGAND